MRMRSCHAWWAIWLVLVIVLPGGKAAARPAESRASARNASAADVISAVNSLRAQHGLPAYSVSSILMGTAQGQADFMASTGSITHSGPGGSTVTQRLLAAGYPLAGDLSLGGFRSENIVGSPGMTPQEAVNAWTGDAPHLNTMLSPNLMEIGAGVAEADGVMYYVIDCARPTGSGLPQDYTPGVEADFSGGDDIIIPVKMSTPNPQGYIYHEVQAGQSLWAIAIAYGVKIKDLQQLNGLGAGTTLQKGQKLLVKRVGTPTPAPPTATATMEAETLTPEPTLDLATPTLIIIPSATPTAYMSSSASAGGAVAAITVVALIAAALVAWAGRSRSV